MNTSTQEVLSNHNTVAEANTIPESPLSSAHFQATISSDTSAPDEKIETKRQNRFQNGSAYPISGATSDSPRNASPGKHALIVTNKSPNTPRSSNPRIARFADPASGEQSPLTPRMSTVPEDEVPVRDGQEDISHNTIQSSREGPEVKESILQSHTPTDDERQETARAPTLYARLRALASSQGLTHSRSASGLSFRSAIGQDEPRNEVAMMATLEDHGTDGETEGDADEESGPEGSMSQSQIQKRKKTFRRQDDAKTAPSSPLETRRPVMHTAQSSRPSSLTRPFSLSRRITDPDMVAGVSEDEGRRKLAASPIWSPRHPLRGLSQGNSRRPDNTAGEEQSRRPLNLSNLYSSSSRDQTLASPVPETPGPKPSRRKMLQERGTTLSAAKWKQIKNGLRAFAQGKKKERTQDQEKSAELLAELAAGTPAALMLASVFQRDEHGSRRIPALLEQLKVSITDSEIAKYKDPGNPTPGDKHIIFRIELEYGSGVNRMKWVIRRSLRDFANLHLKYKFHYSSEKVKGRGDSAKRMPKFPKSVFPVLTGVKDFDDEDGDEDTAIDTDGGATDTERPGFGPRNRARTSFMLNRRHSSVGNENPPVTPGGTIIFRRNKDQDRERDQKFPERQRKLLELYLQRMIKFMLFRADANRLCKFLELSALGIRLASEGSYHGKEGFLVIRSAKGLDFRRTLTPSNVKNRHAPKWFLVRHSYIVCVDSPEGMYVYDVFLFDSDLRIQSSKPLFKEEREKRQISTAAKEIAANSKEIAKHPRNHRLKLVNSERRLKLLARNERVLHQFEESIRSMVETSPWCQKNRFDSFAPVRSKCFAQWLVDGRDHMWVVSRALKQAKDVIYIHDWWLSPELYMRRPAAISQKWRLDRILKEKAEQGVKVFVIVYRNIDAAVPIDSQYTKFSLLDLHPNVFVQRSPNQFRQNTFFWAHHEKLCIIDHTLAFVGGIDLCFGRWDTPQHALTDDKPTGFQGHDAPKDADHCQLWPGKDYSNPRIQDFYALNKPYEEMYNRTRVARMPWHDISMQIVGQPARDLTRHFVQRWNYILRQRKPTRPTPFLLPPPDFNTADLEALGLDGTCEVQLLRSAGPWSIGTPDKTEHSIMNAYAKMIEESEHFVYIENQFFITSCETEGATVHNTIGEALVERVTRAHQNNEAWRAIIVIPLIPGFQNTVEEEGGTSVRLIMQYQYRSICRGESSMFGRLKARGIEPEEYIQFYSLRQWGKIGPKQSLVTEQLYIHAKVIIVDDRIALIGSANINERSQLGNRDSEVAAVVRDTDMLWSTMNGEPYRVGRFAYSLRMRLMREHLGLDVDQIMEDAQVIEHEYKKMHSTLPEHSASKAPADSTEVDPLDARGRELQEELLQRNEKLHTFNHDVDWEQADNPNLRTNRKITEDSRVTGKPEHRQDVNGEGFDHMNEIEKAGLGNARDTIVLRSGKEILTTEQDPEGKRTMADPLKHGDVLRLPSYVRKVEAPNPPMPPKPTLSRMHSDELGLTMISQLPPLPDSDDTDIGGPALEKIDTDDSIPAHPLLAELRYPLVDRDCMTDPIHFRFADEIWRQIAENNTKIYRAVFRCMPDNQVRDWSDYHEYVAYEQRFNHMQGQDSSSDLVSAPEMDGKRAGPPGVGASMIQAQIKHLSHIPTDIEKTAGLTKDKVMDAFKDKEGRKSESSEVDKEALKSWAAEANRAQMKRQGTDLSLRTFPPLEEKKSLQTVPEDGQFNHRPESSESATSEKINEKSSGTAAGSQMGTSIGTHSNSVRRRRRGTTRSSRRDFSAADDMMSLAEAEELLGKVQGNLIEWPYDWLEKVEAGGNWLFPFDQISPIEIYI